MNYSLNGLLSQTFFFFPPASGSIYGFNVEASRSIQQLAAKRGVPLRLHSVIYKLIDELKDELSAKLPPLVSENIIGEETFCVEPRVFVLM